MEPRPAYSMEKIDTAGIFSGRAKNRKKVKQNRNEKWEGYPGNAGGMERNWLLQRAGAEWPGQHCDLEEKAARWELGP